MKRVIITTIIVLSIQAAIIFMSLLILMGASPMGFALGYPYAFLIPYLVCQNSDAQFGFGILIAIFQVVMYIYFLSAKNFSIVTSLIFITVIHLIAAFALFTIPYYKPIFKHPNAKSHSHVVLTKSFNQTVSPLINSALDSER